MIDYEINLIMADVKAAIERLAAAHTPAQVERAEDLLCMETRSLFNRYVDLVLWAGEFDGAVYKRVRNAINLGAEAVQASESDAANSIRNRLAEFDDFLIEAKKKSGLIPV